MATQEQVYKELTIIGNNIAKKGGTMISANKSFSLSELANGVMSIPTVASIVVSNTDSAIVWEMPATTISVYDLNSTLIGSDTTDATIGGMVQINVGAPGTYRIVATKNGSEFWNRQVAINGPTLVKTSLSISEYTEDEIEVSCVNHYAHNMFEIGDYRLEATFMGSTSTTYRKKYILGFNCKELASGGYAEILWGFLAGTPSTYKMDSTSSNTCSWVGSEMRQRCLPAGEDYYRYDSTVTAATEGTYYIYDYANFAWVAKTLPADFDANANYYVKSTTASDGVFYTNALPSTTMAHAKKVKNLTWTGHIKGETSYSANLSSNSIIQTEEYLFLPSVFEIFGVNGTSSMASNGYWANNKNEGNWCEAPFNKVFQPMSNKTLFFRSPSVSNASSFDNWYNNTGYVYNNSATTANAALLCYCQ